MRAVIKSKHSGIYNVSQISSEYDLTRDAYYKSLRRYNKQESDRKRVLSMVQARRDILPREGCRKLYLSLFDGFKAKGLKIRRDDKLFSILRSEDMLVARKKASFKSTNSYHHFYKYGNLIKAIEIECVNQVWVSDITYIRTVKDFCYLALITGLCFRKTVGYVSDFSKLSGSLRAPQKALASNKSRKRLIHHSDRDVQYCSHAYVNKLKSKDILIRMTKESHCYKNAVAERANDVLKDEFYLNQTFFDTSYAKRVTKSAIKTYNELRLHVSL